MDGLGGIHANRAPEDLDGVLAASLLEKHFGQRAQVRRFVRRLGGGFPESLFGFEDLVAALVDEPQPVMGEGAEPGVAAMEVDTPVSVEGFGVRPAFVGDESRKVLGGRMSGRGLEDSAAETGGLLETALDEESGEAREAFLGTGERRKRAHGVACGAGPPRLRRASSSRSRSMATSSGARRKFGVWLGLTMMPAFSGVQARAKTASISVRWGSPPVDSWNRRARSAFEKTASMGCAVFGPSETRLMRAS